MRTHQPQALTRNTCNCKSHIGEKIMWLRWRYDMRSSMLFEETCNYYGNTCDLGTGCV